MERLADRLLFGFIAIMASLLLVSLALVFALCDIRDELRLIAKPGAATHVAGASFDKGKP